VERIRTNSRKKGPMLRRLEAAGWLCIMLFALAACVRAPIKPQPESFSSLDRLVGTYYFYWYKYPTEHFFDNRETNDDALTDHFVRPEEIDYESVDWHCREMSDMAWCGIDFLLPVYWGAPGAYEGGFSVKGLKTLQEASEQLIASGKRCPRIGMFYDTSTLLNDLRGDPPRGGKADLTTPHGKEVFYHTIRDYWRRLDRKHWAMIDGRPIVVLYSAAFSSGFDQSTFDYVYENFERDFGVRPYVIAEASWKPAKADGYYRWGAALTGPNIDEVAQIGPGYDDRAVPGRSTPIRDREKGRFYEHSWIEALKSERRIVLIETWNEMHEGTDVCESVEYGRRYMRLTRKWAPRFHHGKSTDKTVELEHRKPLPPGPSDEGKEFADAREISVDFAAGSQKGLRAISAGDGLFKVVEAAGRRCIRSEPGKYAYFYFRVPDPFFFGLHEPVEIEIEYLDGGNGDLVLHYDSRDEDAHMGGAYTVGEVIHRNGTGRWVVHTIRLNNAAFRSRQNHMSDFRFAVVGEPVCVSRVVVRKLGKTP